MVEFRWCAVVTEEALEDFLGKWNACLKGKNGGDVGESDGTRAVARVRRVLSTQICATFTIGIVPSERR